VTVSQSAGSLADSNPLRLAALEMDHKIAARLVEWQHRVERHERNTEFRQDFGDSLLVFVYGKVKAGKSSLGNYVAYGSSDPDPQTVEAARNKGQAPDFFLKASTTDNPEQGEARLKQAGKFAVGVVETTSAIQGFRLPGLTWVDSPGLHSATEANGELARQYAEAADLILYPMNSGQPGRASDLDEIAGLLRGRKPFLPLITRCDFMDLDEDEEGNIVRTLQMKSARDRQEQSSRIQEDIIAKAREESRQLLDTHLLTVSVRYAETYPHATQALHDSGLSSLFAAMTKLTHEQGVTLKKETPLNNLRSFVDQILAGDLSTRTLQHDLKTVLEQVNQQRDRLEKSRLAVVGQVMCELDPAIGDIVRQQGGKSDTRQLVQQCQDITRQIVTRHTTKALAEALKHAETALTGALRFDQFNAIPEFRDIYEDIYVSRQTRNQAVGSGLGTVVGGLVGLLGGPIGSTVGSVFGGILGSQLGKLVDGDSRQSVVVGNNLQEINQATLETASHAAHQAITQTFAQFDQQFLWPVEKTAHDLTAALQHFETQLQKEVRP
jgi:predicted GTPase